MPRKPKYELQYPEWVKALRDPCLKSVVKEALSARDFATDAGAERYKTCAKLLRVGDTILRSIEDGRATGPAAWKKAADALRKYTVALECAHPTARRRQQGRQHHAPLIGA